MPSFLVCRPDYFDSTFMFNPWMDYTESVDPDLAIKQWERMVAELTAVGADVRYLEPSPYSPAQVFTADGAIVTGANHALVLRNDGPRGTLELRNFAEWLKSDGFSVESIPPNRRIDGGNVLKLHDGSYAVGMKPGSDGSSERYLEKILELTNGAKLHRIRLVDQKFLHLDMALGKLGNDGYLVFESAFENGLESLDSTPVAEKQIIPVSRKDAETYACNGVTIGNTFLTGNISSSLIDSIEGLGYRTVTLDLGEFHKAGGGLKCLTLPLN